MVVWPGFVLGPGLVLEPGQFFNAAVDRGLISGRDASFLLDCNVSHFDR